MSLRIALASVIVGGFASQALAQAPAQSLQPQTAAAGQEQQLLSSVQLDALVAPIALYPDDLLAHVLMASTYPLEVVQADRWVAANKKLGADQLKAAFDKQRWDASVKSLVATPAVLEMMSKNLDWTKKLGDAVLAQQPDVMDGIQRMRARAYEAKKLAPSAQQKVSVQQVSGKQTILIESASPDTIYVPYYDPAVVYGPWPYPATPPYYFPAPSHVATGIIATGIAFGAGYALGRWVSGGYWGGNVNWVGGSINIDRNRVTHWEHNALHRHGVRYGNDAVRQKFSNASIGAGSEGRMDFRGRNGEAVLQPEGGRSAAGGAGRPEQRPTDRPGVGDRPDRTGGDRISPGNPQERPAADRGRLVSLPRAATQPQRPSPGAERNRPTRDSPFNVQAGRAANLQSQRGHASMSRSVGAGRGGGAAHMSRGGGGGRAGGGRRSELPFEKHGILMARMENERGYHGFVDGTAAISAWKVVAP